MRPVSPPKRFLALDVMRGIAVLSMIQGHTFTALLRPEAYEGDWSRWHTLFHGLTAPMFLLGGGLAYGIVTLRTLAPASNDPTRLARRAFMLLAIGYWLQVPRVTWAEIFGNRELLALTLRVGPLQLVGVCLLISEMLRWSLRSRLGLQLAIASLTVLTAGVAPWVWNARWSEHGPLAVGTWLDGYAGSLFPFFPWAAFFFLGTLVATWLLRVRESGNDSPQRWFAPSLIGIGFGAAGLAYAMFINHQVLRGIYGEHELWHTNPLYVLFRAGLVLACLGLLSSVEPAIRWAWRTFPTMDRLFGVISRQSLVAYVTHLLVLYGTPLTKGLAKLGTTLDMFEVSVTTFFVLLFTTAIAVIWDHAITQRALTRWVARLARRVPVARLFQVNRVGERHREHAVASEQQVEPAASAGHSV